MINIWKGNFKRLLQSLKYLWFERKLERTRAKVRKKIANREENKRGGR